MTLSTSAPCTHPGSCRATPVRMRARGDRGWKESVTNQPVPHCRLCNALAVDAVDVGFTFVCVGCGGDIPTS